MEENGLLGAVAGVGGAIGRAVGDMFAAEKHLNDTLANSPGPGAKFEVKKETVLQSAKVIQDQAIELRRSYRHAERSLRIETGGMDEINADVADAWNDRLVGHPESYAVRIEQYLQSLDDLVEKLRGAAQQYGFTEDDINAALGSAGASR